MNGLEESRNKMKVLLLILMVCAFSVSLYSQEAPTATLATAAGPATKAGTATVYIYRMPRMTGLLVHPMVYCDGVATKPIKNKHYFVLELPAGKHLLVPGAGMTTPAMNDFEPGKVYYFQTQLHAFTLSMSNTPMWELIAVDSSQAERDLKGLKKD